ncbi:MAG: Na+/H+ antiporter NhaA [Planctomycetes bacterium]|nr:Na+/H+ antiporter NhaA [Planctomycetota bacterium]
MVKPTIRFLLENSLFLIMGAVIALVWANVDDGDGKPGNHAYHDLVHHEILRNPWVGEDHHEPEAPKAEEGAGSTAESEAKPEKDSDDDHGSTKIITLHYLVNDILMALFFAIAGKEVWEATLPGGPLNNPKTAAAPLIATFGGMAGPALVYLAGAAMFGQFDALSNGWAIPCATDIAFSYLVARLVFGAGHPAIPFLLLLAIADDALGLIILAVAYPTKEIEPMWLLLSVGAVILGLAMRRARVRSFWPYLLGAGTLSWFGFAMGGIHPALGLLPIIPTMPHAHVDTGLFDWSKMEKDDTLSAFEHWWKNPVELILGLFGLLNAGVVMSSMGTATTLVLSGLLLGKPIGIWLCGMFAVRVLKFDLPKGMNSKDLFVVGCAAAIGFTVALFVAAVAFKGGEEILDAAKMGALLSFGAAIVTVIAGKLMGVVKVAGTPGKGQGH